MNDEAGQEQAKADSNVSSHPEETKFEANLRAGRFSISIRAQTTPAGLAAAAVLLTAILVPVVFIIKSARAK